MLNSSFIACNAYYTWLPKISIRGQKENANVLNPGNCMAIIKLLAKFDPNEKKTSLDLPQWKAVHVK